MNIKRIHILDILRGFALMGILAANIPSIAHMPIPAVGEAGRAVFDFIELAIEQRFFPIFSLLFGIGFFIFMRNAQEKGVQPYWTMARRLGILVVFGVLHQILQPGEALLPYAIVGFIVLAMYKLPAKGLLIASFIFLVLFGLVMVEQLIIPAMFCLGMFLGKVGYFENREKFRKATLIVWLVSLVLIIPALWAQVNIPIPIYPSPLATLAGLVIASALVTSILLLPKAETFLAWLAPLGRMALTNYILQTVIVYLLTLFIPNLTYAAIPMIWVVILTVQIPLSALWLRHFNYGPLEWLWRWGTYLRKPSRS
ncbi:MAG TPA: DUF418 domain-containing protein [Anaerolineales bacterium]|nr:DUF418 domain-containing protein [Anaerolineales bacterium]